MRKRALYAPHFFCFSLSRHFPWWKARGSVRNVSHSRSNGKKKSVVGAQTAMSRRRREPSSAPAKVRVRPAAIDSAVHKRSRFSLFLYLDISLAPDISLSVLYPFHSCPLSISLSLPPCVRSSSFCPLSLFFSLPISFSIAPLWIAYSLWRTSMVRPIAFDVPARYPRALTAHVYKATASRYDPTLCHVTRSPGAHTLPRRFLSLFYTHLFPIFSLFRFRLLPFLSLLPILVPFPITSSHSSLLSSQISLFLLFSPVLASITLIFLIIISNLTPPCLLYPVYSSSLFLCFYVSLLFPRSD